MSPAEIKEFLQAGTRTGKLATVCDDMAELAHWARRIAGRYMGRDQAEAFGQRNSVAGELVVRVTPVKVIAKKDMAGW